MRASKLPWLLCGVLFVLALAPYLQTARFELINYDDPIYVNPPSRVAEGLNLSSLRWAFSTFHFNWHPLTWISHMLDYSLFGGSSGAMHLHSAVLHSVNAVLLFMVLLRLTRQYWPAAVVAALFAVHPLRVEAVVWISARKDVLSAFFTLVTILLYSEYARRKETGRPSTALYLISLVAMALGLMAKGMLVTLPFILLLLDVWPLHRCDPGRLLERDRAALRRFLQLFVEKIPMFAVALAGAIVTVVGQVVVDAVVDAEGISLPWRVANAAIAYVIYLAQTIWPINLSIFYPHPAVLGHSFPWIKTSLATVFLLTVTGGAVACRRRYPYVLVGWLWYVITLVPVLGLIQIGSHAHADRYTYIASIGIFTAIVWSAIDLARRWRLPLWVLAGCAIASVVALSIASHKQAGHWRNSETLFAHATAATPDSYVARNQLGLALIEEKQLRRAAQEFAIAVDTYPRYASGHNNLAIALQRMGDVPGALEQYDLALQYDPGYVDAMINLGSLLFTIDREQEAVPYFSKVAELRPLDATARYDYGVALATVGRMDQAIAELKAALAIRPDYAEASKALLQAITLRDDYRRRQSAGIMPATTTQASTAPVTNPAPADPSGSGNPAAPR